eukprot:5032231-Pleurochrysis_carterae.AAC.1
MAIAQAVATRISLAPPTTDVAAASQPEQSSLDLPARFSAASRNVATTDPNTIAPTLNDNRPTDDDAANPASAESTDLQRHFQRGLGAYPLRNRSPAALLTVRDTA